MPRNSRRRRMVRAAIRLLQKGLIYTGAFAWPCVEVVIALREREHTDAQAGLDDLPTPAVPQVPTPRHPETVTALDDLPESQRRVLLALEAQLQAENEK